MKPTASRAAVIFTAAVLLAAVVLLATSRLEYCGQPDALRPDRGAVAADEGRLPTLAPVQKVVIVRIEADKPDLEIAWADN